MSAWGGSSSSSGASSPNSGRPDCVLVVKCTFAQGRMRRITFANARTVEWDLFQSRVEQAFSLSASSFRVYYTDDDGDDTDIACDADLDEAVAYFSSGSSLDEADDPSPASASDRITMRVNVLVEYDGPSLSDAGSTRGSSAWGSTSDSGGACSERSISLSCSAASSSSTSHHRPKPRYIGDADSIHLSDTDSTGSFPSFNPPPRQPQHAQAYFREPQIRPSDSVPSLASAIPSPPLSESPPSSEDATTTRQPEDDDWDTLSLAETHRQGPARTYPPSNASSYTPPLRPTDSTPSLSPSSTSTNRSPTVRSPLSDQAPPESPFADPHQPEPQPPTSLMQHLRLVPNESGPGRGELAARWFAEQNERALLMTFGTQLAPSETDTSSEFSSELELELEQDSRGSYRYTVTGSSEADGESEWDEGSVFGEQAAAAASSGSLTLQSRWSESTPYSSRSASSGSFHSSDLLPYPIPFGPPPACTLTHCSSCSTPLDNMRYICTHCGPLRPGGLGYELCASCVESVGVVHAAESGDATSRMGNRHSFRECVWGEAGWAEVQYDDETHCTICSCSLASNAFKCVSCPRFSLCNGCYDRVRDIHPVHAFLSLPRRSPSSSSSSSSSIPRLPPPPAPRRRPARPLRRGTGERPPPVPPRPAKHPGVFCHNCMQDIVGPRFHCAVCASYDLCEACEAAGAASANDHDPTHIMMKIPVPLSSVELKNASARALELWTHHDAPAILPCHHEHNGHFSSPYPMSSAGSSAPPIPTLAPPPGPPEILTRPIAPRNGADGAAGSGRPRRRRRDHGVQCRGCGTRIVGTRYCCANCPTFPEAYDLCADCEPLSYILHDPLHAFLKFDYLLASPLALRKPALPELYRLPAGEIPPPNSWTNGQRDGAAEDRGHTGPNDYLVHIAHPSVVCDRCMRPVIGAWHRCVNLAGSYDLCASCEPDDPNSSNHIYLVLKSVVDMGMFRRLAGIASGLESARSALLPNLKYAI